VPYIFPTLALSAVAQPAFAAFTRAIRAAKHFVPGFHAVTDDVAPAMIALRRHDVDRAFEAIEDARFAVSPNLKCFVVIVSAVFAFRHNPSSV
jgi:hypothetical protein